MKHYRAAVLVRLNQQSKAFEFLIQDEFFPEKSRHMAKFPGGMESKSNESAAENLFRELNDELLSTGSAFSFQVAVENSLRLKGNPFSSAYDSLNRIEKDYFLILEPEGLSFSDLPLRKNPRVDGNTVLKDIHWERVSRFIPDKLPKHHLQAYSDLVKFFVDNRINFEQ